MRRHHERGAILVETTIIVTFMLTLLLFALELGLLGFLQVTADAAAFFDARENIIGVTNPLLSPEQATYKTFHGLTNASIVPQVVPAPTPTVAVDYGYNDPSPSVQASSASSRHGGVSMLQPVQLQAKVSNVKPLSLIGKGGVSVTSQDTEAKWTECGPHYNVVNENYACGDPSAPPDSAVSYSSAENTAPYYVGYNFFTRCEDAQPWGDTVSGFAVNSTCQDTQLDSMGMAEYLYDSNWGAADSGISGTNGQSTFQAMACHQRVYANLAGFFASYPKISQIYQTYIGSIANQIGSGSFSDFRNWSGFNDGGAGTTADNNIQSIYDWDVYINTGYPPSSYTEPGAYPLNPLGNQVSSQTAPVSC